jgi:hypothetical protein
MKKKIMSFIFITASLFGCANFSQADLQSDAVQIQSSYAQIRSIVALASSSGELSSSSEAQIASLEATLDPEIAALSNATDPSSFQKVMQDVSIFVNALPPSQVKNDAQDVIDAIDLISGL